MSQEKSPETAGRKITLPQARTMVEAYEKSCSDTDVRSLTISAKYLRSIIDQPDCEYVRFYLAVADPKATARALPAGHSLVVIGADSSSNNIKNGDEDTEIYEDLGVCPPSCFGDLAL